MTAFIHIKLKARNQKRVWNDEISHTNTMLKHCLDLEGISFNTSNVKRYEEFAFIWNFLRVFTNTGGNINTNLLTDKYNVLNHINNKAYCNHNLLKRDFYNRILRPFESMSKNTFYLDLKIRQSYSTRIDSNYISSGIDKMIKHALLRIINTGHSFYNLISFAGPTISYSVTRSDVVELDGYYYVTVKVE